MKNNDKSDKEYLAEVIGWAEKVWDTGRGRRGLSGDAAPASAPKPAFAAEFVALRNRLAARRKAGQRFPAEEDLRKRKFSDVEIQALYLCLYCALIDRSSASVSDLIRKLCLINGARNTDMAILLQPGGRLLASSLLRNSNSYQATLITNVELHPLLLRKFLGWRLPPAKKAAPEAPLTAKVIHAKLGESVIGQEEAKRRIAAAAFRHLTATKLNRSREPQLRIQKANILIIGPTGTGKTHIARALAEILKVPFAACDATQYTEAGYVGMNVEDMLVRLFNEAGKNYERMQNGVIYIDEIDKIAAHDSRLGHNSTKDVSGLSVQQELLKLLDGDRINYSRRNGVSEAEYEFKVGGVLFVAGGAFQGLDEIVKERLKRKASIGFTGGAEGKEAAAELPWQRQIITEDLIAYGFIPEFIGRFASIVTLDPLSEDDVLGILTKPRNSLMSQYNDLLKEAGVASNFNEQDLRAVAHEAHALNTGARGLKAIMEARVAPLLFEVGAKPVVEPAPDSGKAA